MTTPNKIQVTCPACGFRLRAPAETAGKRGRCPKCKVGLTIPLPSQAPEADELPLADEEPAPKPTAAARANAKMDEEVAQKWNAKARQAQKRKGRTPAAPRPRSEGKLGMVLTFLFLLLLAAGIGTWVVITEMQTPAPNGEHR
jgi:hypothetical protein